MALLEPLLHTPNVRLFDDREESYDRGWPCSRDPVDNDPKPRITSWRGKTIWELYSSVRMSREFRRSPGCV